MGFVSQEWTIFKGFKLLDYSSAVWILKPSFLSVATFAILVASKSPFSVIKLGSFMCGKITVELELNGAWCFIDKAMSVTAKTECF